MLSKKCEMINTYIQDRVMSYFFHHNLFFKGTSCRIYKNDGRRLHEKYKKDVKSTEYSILWEISEKVYLMIVLTIFAIYWDFSSKNIFELH
jgi:hypothetical protein